MMFRHYPVLGNPSILRPHLVAKNIWTLRFRPDFKRLLMVSLFMFVANKYAIWSILELSWYTRYRGPMGSPKNDKKCRTWKSRMFSRSSFASDCSESIGATASVGISSALWLRDKARFSCQDFLVPWAVSVVFQLRSLRENWKPRKNLGTNLGTQHNPTIFFRDVTLRYLGLGKLDKSTAGSFYTHRNSWFHHNFSVSSIYIAGHGASAYWGWQHRGSPQICQKTINICFTIGGLTFCYDAFELCEFNKWHPSQHFLKSGPTTEAHARNISKSIFSSKTSLVSARKKTRHRLTDLGSPTESFPQALPIPEAWGRDLPTCGA